MKLPQADQWLSTGTLRKIGGLRTYGQRMQFYLGFANTATLMIVLYETSGLVNSLFPSMAVWLLFIGFVAIPAAVGFDYTIFHVAQITYNQHQNGHENRSPNYRETMTNQRLIEDLHEEIQELQRADARADGGQTLVVPECSDCNTRGQSGTHKGESCIKCPDCDSILYRRMEAAR